MLHQLKIFIIFTILFTLPIYPQKIESINIDGNLHYKKSDYLKWIKINEGQKYYEGLKDSIKKRIAINLNQNGFMNFGKIKVSVSPYDQTNNKIIVINIDEGKPTYFNKFYIEGISKQDSEFVFTSFKNLKENIFNKTELEGVINEVLTYFENNGNPFTVLKINSINFYSDSTSGTYFTDIFIAIDEKKKRTIDKINIEGNEKTKNFVIIRELRLNPGDIYSQDKIDVLSDRLNKLGFFQTVQKPEYYIDEQGNGILSFKIKEIQTNNFDGIIGYIPGTTPKESGYVTGLIDIKLRNLFGTGRGLSFKWQKLDRSSQLLDINYLEPWIFGMPVNVSSRIFQRKQDSSYVQRNFDLNLEYLASDVLSAGVTLSLESVIPSDNVSQQFTVFNSTIFNTGLSLKLDTRNDYYSPTKGIRFINSYSFRKKTINGPAKFINASTPTNVNLQKLELSFDAFFSFVKRQVLAIKLRGGELRGAFFETSDMFRMGGFNSLRGYREDQFLGSRIIWSNLEYRFLLTDRTYFFVFLDNGYFLRKEDLKRNIPKLEGFKKGYGLGLNIETSLGILGVSFALGQGDSFSDGKIHFGIINNF